MFDKNKKCIFVKHFLFQNAKHFFVLHLKQKKVSIFCQCFKIQTKKVNKKSKTTIENTKTKIVFETLTFTKNV